MRSVAHHGRPLPADGTTTRAAQRTLQAGHWGAAHSQQPGCTRSTDRVVQEARGTALRALTQPERMAVTPSVARPVNATAIPRRENATLPRHAWPICQGLRVFAQAQAPQGTRENDSESDAEDQE